MGINMFQLRQTILPVKPDLYQELTRVCSHLFKNETDFIANAANLSALLFNSLPDLNWAGIYIKRGQQLVLGPFQGQPACVRIDLEKGVCGTAARKQKTVIVKNVHKFPGHIACDLASLSEIVVPLIKDKKLLGVLDLDSPLEERFDQDDKRGLQRIVRVFLKHTGSVDTI
jgi:L-methionine (R)-S-oxide reductase